MVRRTLSRVLDLLLSDGQWLKRASFGWLPVAYLRTMPAFYRGVDPIIEHDHGSAPGLIKHSEAKPSYPPVRCSAALISLARHLITSPAPSQPIGVGHGAQRPQ